MQTFIRIHPKDSAAVALRPLSAGTVIRLDDLLSFEVHTPKKAQQPL